MIRTARLVLRRARVEDAETLFPIFSDPRAMRYWSTLPHTDIAQTQAIVEGLMFDKNADEFVVEHQGQVIGKAGIWKKGEFGFILSPDVWGQGFGYEASKAVIERFFGMHRDGAELLADVDPRNTASLKLLEKLGFRQTSTAKRTFLLGDEWCDSVYLTLRLDPAPPLNSPKVPV